MTTCKLLVGKGKNSTPMADMMLPTRFIFQKPMTGNKGSGKQRHVSEDTKVNLGELTEIPKARLWEGRGNN